MPTASDEEILERSRQIVDGYLADNPGGSERLIALLHRVQEEIGYLPFPTQEYVAARLAMSPVQVFSVVSFYHFFTTVPRGRFQVKVCMGTACYVRGGQTLLEALAEHLKVEVGSISPDRMFNLEQVRCIGACGLAPAIMVNNEVFGNLTPDAIRKLARKLRSQARAELQAASEGRGEASA
jgi:NADH:ubiquinone oxidoreductase subunit E